MPGGIKSSIFSLARRKNAMIAAKNNRVITPPKVKVSGDPFMPHEVPLASYFDARMGQVVRKNDGHIVRCPRTSRAFRRAFNGAFGKEKESIKEWCS